MDRKLQVNSMLEVNAGRGNVKGGGNIVLLTDEEEEEEEE